MIRSAQSTIRQISHLTTKPTASPSKSLRSLLLPVRTQATKSSDNNMSEYEQIMRMGIYHHHHSSSQSPRTSSSMSSRASKSTQSGSSSSTTQQEAVSNAYRSVVEPTVYEDYDFLYEGNYHRPRMAAGGTTTTTYRYSNLNEGGGEAGSVV